MFEILSYYCLGVIGAWLFSDGLYSILLYLNKPGYNGAEQTWRRDHWIRALRGVLGLIIMALGAILLLKEVL